MRQTLYYPSRVHMTSFMPPRTCEAGALIITLMLQVGKLGFGEEESLAPITQTVCSEPGRRWEGVPGGGNSRLEAGRGCVFVGWERNSRKSGQSISG